MISKVYSVAIEWLDGTLIEVEADYHSGKAKFFLVGLPDAAVQESKERVRSAIKSSDYWFPTQRITINLAPADTKKSGPSFDLPIAIALVGQRTSFDQEKVDESIFIGELGLDGTIRPVSSVLPATIFAKEKGYKRIFVPADNAQEAALVPGIDVIAVRDLTSCIQYLTGEEIIEPLAQTQPEELIPELRNPGIDFDQVVGQETAKRALLIAAAGGHNALMEWPPGSGKTMLAKAFATILPEMTFPEIIEVSKIYSVAGLLSKDQPLIVNRPFRKIHHTASSASIIGGGRDSRPGEISLAHRGVLFLDEFLEFPTQVLETLRQPIEDGEITINRVHSSYTYPAQFMLIGALNPCPCGYMNDPVKECTCAPFAIERYRNRLSGPLLDRMDIFIHVPRVDIEDIKKKETGTSSEELMKQVVSARERQASRFEQSEKTCNAEMSNSDIQKYCELPEDVAKFLQDATERLDLSTRAYFRILRLARTITDLADRDDIILEDIAEALGYRQEG